VEQHIFVQILQCYRATTPLFNTTAKHMAQTRIL